MDKPVKFIRAGSLNTSEKYLYRTSPGSVDDQDYTTVTFVGYTACPAIVVVQDFKMARIRCNRMDLFIPSNYGEVSLVALNFTRHSRTMFTRYDRSMFTTHRRSVFTTVAESLPRSQQRESEGHGANPHELPERHHLSAEKWRE
jgi:hypothetical protein